MSLAMGAALAPGCGRRQDAGHGRASHTGGTNAMRRPKLLSVPSEQREEGFLRMGLRDATQEENSIQDIDIQRLADMGIRCVLVDRDNTCVPRGKEDVPAEVAEWFARLRDAGMTACIVSNNFRNRHIAKTADQLGCGFVSLAWKPTPFALHRVLRILRFKPSETVMIGDQSYTDIVAGNLVGMMTILVRPQDPDAEPRYTRLMRRLFDNERKAGQRHMREGFLEDDPGDD